jgi:hypothetical protein
MNPVCVTAGVSKTVSSCRSPVIEQRPTGRHRIGEPVEDSPMLVTLGNSACSVTPMQSFDPRTLAILAVSALVAFGLLYWVFGTTLGYAIGVTVAYAVIALVATYFKSRSSS